MADPWKGPAAVLYGLVTNCSYGVVNNALRGDEGTGDHV